MLTRLFTIWLVPCCPWHLLHWVWRHEKQQREMNDMDRPIFQPPTPQQTQQALESSIAHWRRNANRARLLQQIHTGSSQCALCTLFNSFLGYAGYEPCKGCPVFEKTTVGYCVWTPYQKIVNIDGFRPDWAKLEAACWEEVNFLESLRVRGPSILERVFGLLNFLYKLKNKNK